MLQSLLFHASLFFDTCLIPFTLQSHLVHSILHKPKDKSK